MAHLSEEELLRLQKLSNIHLDDKEKEIFLSQLDDIIWFLQQLSEVDTTDVEPLTHPTTGHIAPLMDQEPNKPDDGSLLKNIKHRLVNNAVKIKSMLS